MNLVDLCAYLHDNHIEIVFRDDHTKLDPNDYILTPDIYSLKCNVGIKVPQGMSPDEYMATIPTQLVIAVHRYSIMLHRLEHGGSDCAWPLPPQGDVGMNHPDTHRVLDAIHEAVAATNGVPGGAMLYWVTRRAPANTRYIDLLHDTDHCLNPGGTEEYKIAQFEICRGRRYRVTSLHAWMQRSAYWRSLLPDVPTSPGSAGLGSEDGPGAPDR